MIGSLHKCFVSRFPENRDARSAFVLAPASVADYMPTIDALPETYADAKEAIAGALGGKFAAHKFVEWRWFADYALYDNKFELKPKGSK